MRMTKEQLLDAARRAAKYLPAASAELMNELANRLDVTSVALSESLERRSILTTENAGLKSVLETLEKARQRIAELEAQNEYIRKRYQQLDLLIGKNILVMQAAIVEWQATGNAKNGLAWIYNTLFGPGELPDENEKDAQAYFDRKYAPLDEELMALHKWFWEQSEAERAAAGINLAMGELSDEGGKDRFGLNVASSACPDEGFVAVFEFAQLRENKGAQQ